MGGIAGGWRYRASVLEVGGSLVGWWVIFIISASQQRVRTLHGGWDGGSARLMMGADLAVEVPQLVDGVADAIARKDKALYWLCIGARATLYVVQGIATLSITVSVATQAHVPEKGASMAPDQKGGQRYGLSWYHNVTTSIVTDQKLREVVEVARLYPKTTPARGTGPGRYMVATAIVCTPTPYPKDDGDGTGDDGGALPLGCLRVHRLGSRCRLLCNYGLCGWRLLHSKHMTPYVPNHGEQPTLPSSVEYRSTVRAGALKGAARLCSDRNCTHIGMLCKMQGRGRAQGCTNAVVLVCMVVEVARRLSRARLRADPTRMSVQ